MMPIITVINFSLFVFILLSFLFLSFLVFFFDEFLLFSILIGYAFSIKCQDENQSSKRSSLGYRQEECFSFSFSRENIVKS